MGKYKRVVGRLKARFAASKTALAAALGEVASAVEHAGYLAGILAETGNENAEVALFEWAVRRGTMWE